MNTIISVVTNSKFGIWNIPMRGQNFINNHYASINGYKISFVITEGILFNNFNLVKSAIKKNNNKKIILVFCSTLQLLELKISNNEFIDFYKNFEIHFSLELKKGKGKKYLDNIFRELKGYSKRKNIELKNINSYSDLYKKFKNKII